MKTNFFLILSGLASLSVGALSAESESWSSLFNGQDLSGWDALFIKNNTDKSGQASDYFPVTNGVIHVYQGKQADSLQPFAAIQTQASYSSYRFYVEYKWGTAKFAPRHEMLRDAGILYHVHGFGEPAWPLSVESQIQEGDSGDTYVIGTQAQTFADANSYLHQPVGSVSSWRFLPQEQGGVARWIGAPGKILRIKHNQVLEHEGWNTMEVVVRNDRSVHLVNGVVNMRLSHLKRWDEASASWLPLTEGKIVLQAEGAEVFYRKMKIRPIEAGDPE